MKKIIIGGGRAGRELAAQVSESVIIEINPEKREKLSELAGVEVIIGDGRDEELLKRVGLDDVEAFIAITSNDDVNYQAASIAKKHGVPKIIVRVEDPEDSERFQKMGVESIMFPTKIVANLIRDTIHLAAEEAELRTPIKKILVPILRRDTVEKAFKEALFVASVAKAEVTAVSSTDIARHEMESRAMEMGVPLKIFWEEEKLMDIIRRHLNYPGCIILDIVKEHLYYPDCIIIDQEELSILDKLFKRSVVMKLIKCASRPVLVARTFRYYGHILALLDSSETSESVGRHAVQMAHLCGADLHLLILEVVPGELIDKIKKMGEKGNVRIIEKWIEGNPMIEAVKEVRSRNYELAVIPWRGTGVIRADMIKKIVNDAPCSVLTVV
ncbi:MAG: NAD-binding protein [Methanophagales archaeon]|nr:NAD-binding protein [Methanophagales archaeon]MCW3142050.1 NAD-binding protein [Methanophagales archaeon]